MSALATAYFVSCLDVIGMHYFFLYVGAFIAITEALSNFENLAELNFKLPTSLLKKLNRDVQDLDKETLKKDLKDRRNLK